MRIYTLTTIRNRVQTTTLEDAMGLLAWHYRHNPTGPRSWITLTSEWIPLNT